jgi:hypothetical protein
MTEYIKKYKTLIIILGIAIAGFIAYKYYFAVPTESTDPSFIPADLGEGAIGQEILFALESLRLLELDTSIFESAAFKSLVDYTAATTSEPLGRPDPFAPLSSELIEE